MVSPGRETGGGLKRGGFYYLLVQLDVSPGRETGGGLKRQYHRYRNWRWQRFPPVARPGAD